MYWRILGTLALCASPILAQQSRIIEGLKRPAGMVVADGNLYIADNGTGRIWFLDLKTKDLELFLEDQRLQSPSGLAADEVNLYVADQKAHAVFGINRKTRKLDTLWVGDDNSAPCDLVFSSPYRYESQQLQRKKELVIVDENAKGIYSLLLNGAKGELRQWKTTQLSDPASIFSLGRQYIVADRGAGAIFESEGMSDWINLVADTRHTEKERPGVFFPKLQAPSDVIYSGDIYYIIDKENIYAAVNRGTRLVRLVYRKQPIKKPARLLVEESNLFISDEDAGKVVIWPMLVPVTVEVEARKNTSDILGDIYLYLWRLGVLPLTEVQLPYKDESGRVCATVESLVEECRNLLPQSNDAIQTVLCEANPRLCSKGLLVLPRDAPFWFPDVPFEKYLFLTSQTLTGQSSVRAILNDFIPDGSLRQRVNQEYLQNLNPKLGEKEILTLKQLETSLTIPIQRNRYYVTVPRSELYDKKSQLLNLVRQDPRLRIRSTEAPSLKGVLPDEHASEDMDAKSLAEQYQTVLKNIDYIAERSAEYGDGTDVTVLIAEGRADCKHPVFFTKEKRGAAFAMQGCGAPHGKLDGIVAEWKRDQVRHGTCVSSLLGAREIPYGNKTISPGTELRLAPSAQISDAIQDAYQAHNSSIIVNLSWGKKELTEEQNWRRELTGPLAKYVLYVAAVGNDAGDLENGNEYPAALARQFSNLISVGALDKTGSRLWEDSTTHQGSNYGRLVEILAPGEDVPCALEVIGDPSAEVATYAAVDGTSQAAPLVSAVAALLMQKKLLPGEIKARLLATAEPLDATRGGKQLAVFGKMSVERALKNPMYLHVQFEDPQGGQEDFGTLTKDIKSQIKMRRPRDLEPEPKGLSAILSLRLLSSEGQNGTFYRIVYFDSQNKKVELVERAQLDGCLSYTSKISNELQLLLFGAGCEEFAAWQGNAIRNPKNYIGPRLGAHKFD
jgi:subtilisin family serine protease